MFTEGSMQGAPLGPTYSENDGGSVQHAVPSGPDADLDCEEVQHLSVVPSMRVPLVFDPRWPQKQGGHLVFRCTTPDALEETARRAPPLHQRAGAAVRNRVSATPPPAGLGRRQSYQAGDADARMQACESDACGVDCDPYRSSGVLVVDSYGVGLGERMAQRVAADVSSESLNMHAVDASGPTECEGCVLGECGECVQSAYDALHALEEAHAEDDRMVEVALYPHWELSEVRTGRRASCCLHV